jgi:hypothetical protein
MNKILIAFGFCLFNGWLIYALTFDFDWIAITMILATLMITTFMNKKTTKDLDKKFLKKYDLWRK